jgi:alpha-1,2-mannosyltransferase
VISPSGSAVQGIERPSASPVGGTGTAGLPTPAWIGRWGPKVFAASLTLFGLSTVIWVLAYSNQVDMTIYRFGGHAILTHTPLYDVGLMGHPNELLFNYPPFAALLFTVLALIPDLVLRILVPIGNIALLMMVVRRSWRAFGIGDGKDLRSLVLLSSGVLLWLEPVRTTIALGQVSLLLLTLVVFDLLPSSTPRRWTGIGLGIAAGIKLTPLLFIPYLLLTRRGRAAAVATATFLATIALGFLVAPSQAVEYWFGGVFDDVHRIASADYNANQSLHGMLADLGPRWTGTIVEFAAAIGLALVSLVIASRMHRRGRPLLGLALCGMASAAVSPYSWGYHWVWFVPLAVFLAHGAILERSRMQMALLCLLLMLTAYWVTSLRSPLTSKMPAAGLISLNLSGAWGFVTANLYVIIFGLALMMSVLRRPPEMSEPGAARR